MRSNPRPPFPPQPQPAPGRQTLMEPRPDCGEPSYHGSGRLTDTAAYQMTHPTLADISDEEWVKTFDVNITAMSRLCQAAVPHMPAGGSIINTRSINSDAPNPTLLAYATTKGAIANFTAGLAQLLGEQGIRVNSVAPGPMWTPRPGQSVEVAPLYVLLASDGSSYVSGSRVGETGGKPIL